MDLRELYNMFNALFFSLGENMRFWNFNGETFKKHCFWFFIMLGIFVHSLENLRKNTFKGSFHFLQGEF